MIINNHVIDLCIYYMILFNFRVYSCYLQKTKVFCEPAASSYILCLLCTLIASFSLVFDLISCYFGHRGPSEFIQQHNLLMTRIAECILIVKQHMTMQKILKTSPKTDLNKNDSVKFNKVAAKKINLQKTLSFLSTNKLSLKKTKKTVLFTIASKTVKYLRINLTMKVKDIYSRN